LKLLDAEFVTSAAAGGTADGIPRDGIPQIALAGRSNVGKSSLLNALCRRRIARTSAAPGKTRLANVYRATLEGGTGGPGRWSVYLVDLPGYGYARGGAKSAAELAAVAEAYLTGGKHRPSERGGGGQPSPETGAKARMKRREPGPPSTEKSPRAVLLLVDARHPGLDVDLAAARWLEEIGSERRIVATKVDKLTRAERTRNLATLKRTHGMAALPVSAVSGEGLDELWQTIANLVRR
jgi:GTP-binding protein